ncbi:GAF domain-containing sensor histidine kinase [Halobacterium sp. KA-6]|uniref:GAF domain-containing sensor histidine kinase n=1 Tax=Halobacterium sp. KA-6 TaxID=2896368 RepID=UPI001E452607|nr:GAF domain-containing sensor histidine kinase [Halobacterium sp. KA-6]MCD2204969.1 GAF domain-containing sensor histidine kinase [Halobacterium sp. KA-6]
MTVSGGEESERMSENEALRRMYRITADTERSYEEKVRDLLQVGCTYLDVEIGFLTEITEGQQYIVEASGDHELLQPGESCPLSEAYCRKTIELEDALTVQHASIDGWENDAAYERFGLEAYIGAKVVLDDEVYGTFCFADSEPREKPFSPMEETFVELMAEWVSSQLFQQRATERIKQQRDQLEEFAGIVSHDLRNPINVAQGYLDLAEKTGDPESFQQCRDALDRMNEMIDELLVLAREGQEISETETIDLAALIEECWSLVSTHDATISVTTNATIKADRGRLQQLFENLFRNAIEHGGKNVTVRVGTLSAEDGIYIEDDGSGIPEEDRNQIFEDGYSTGESSTGFGLAIVNQIVEAHGWEVCATHSADGGARFEITGVTLIECEEPQS